MAHILLISGNTTTEPYPVYPLGMAYITAALRKAGHMIREYDMLFKTGPENELDLVIRNLKPDIIGISIRNIDNFNYTHSQSYTDAYSGLVRVLRKLSAAPIVLGGPGYSLYPEVLLEKSGADFGIVGEGEVLFPKLIEQLTRGIPLNTSVLYPLKEDSIHCFGTSVRNRDLTQFYLERGGMLNLQTKRGCPLTCTYCSYPQLEGKHYRFREPEAVVDEIEHLRNRYGMDYYAIADAVFNDYEDHFLLVAQELIRRNISIPFTAFLRPEIFQKEDVKLLKAAGLHAVEWGTDGACDTTLKGLGKSFTWNEVLSSNDLFLQEGIAGCHFIMFCGPGETPDTVKEGLINLKHLKQAVVMISLGVRIVPGTKMHRLALQQNMVDEKDDLIEPTYYFSPEIDPSTVDQILRNAFENRKDRVYPMGQDLDKVAVFHQMGYRGPIWNYLINKT